MGWVLGRKRSEATKLKMSKAQKGKKKPPRSEETKQKMAEALKGKKLSEETKQKITKAKTGKMHSEATKLKIGEALKGKELSEATKLKMSKAKKGKKHSEEHCRKISDALKGREFSEEARYAMSETQKQLWKDPEYAKKALKWKGQGNRAEQRLLKLLDRMYPGEWKFVGNGEALIDGRVPDFVHINEKRIIELFGGYWHSEKITGIDVSEHERERIAHFAGAGYSTLIVWEVELDELAKVESKIKCWTNNL